MQANRIKVLFCSKRQMMGSCIPPEEIASVPTRAQGQDSYRLFCVPENHGNKDLVTRIARWAMLLEEFDYEIIHHPGQRVKHMDALSKYPVMVMSDTLTLRLKNAQSEDEGIVTLKALLGSGNSQYFFKKK
ncbi:transposon Tf2-6 polyprotein [Trichonephila inaurata madagascariensis]|uniref:Transposon Tf2-6 polyprotein n=1 Tax=Trichonephila inaurata madagascariensis TaxID=2747483 RepID=A0A8X6YP50_9ARAC|nr:transposon Tf2-6 polyprotein [Trichonephila inaurata madagascariensis]